MQKPAMPADEKDRVKALHDLDILDTPLNPAFERITRLTKQLLDVPMVAISLVDDDRQWFKSEQGLNTCQTGRDISFCGHAILQDEIFLIPDALADERFHDNPLVVDGPHIRFYAGCPIRDSAGHKIGSFCIMDTKPRKMSQEDLMPLKDMCALVEQQLFSHKQREYHSKVMKELDHAKRENLIDALTRVWNREGLEVNFKEHSAHAKHTKQYLGLTIIDIDDFKKINDTYGHNAGDQVLRIVTKRIVAALAEDDVIGRWGGEEFLSIIAMKCATPEECIAIFDRVREAVCKDPVEYEGELINVTASFGVTLTKDLDVNLVDVVAKADNALYKAKNSGKNKCVLEL